MSLFYISVSFFISIDYRQALKILLFVDVRRRACFSRFASEFSLQRYSIFFNSNMDLFFYYCPIKLFLLC